MGATFGGVLLSDGSLCSQPVSSLARVEIKLLIAAMLDAISQLLQQYLSLRGCHVQTEQARVIAKLEPEGISH